MAPRASLLLVLGLASASCTPSVDVQDGGANSETTTGAVGSVGASADETTVGRPDVSSTGAVPPAGTTVSVDDTADDMASDSDGFSFLVYGGGDGQSGGIEECDLWAQDCRDGEKCVPWASDGGGVNATRCTQVAQEAAEVGGACVVQGDALGGDDDCELGAMCYGVDPATNEGHCVALCSGSPDKPVCDAPAADCWLVEEYLIPVCLTPCDPLMPSCEAGHTCVVKDPEDPTSARCTPQFGEALVGDGCEALDACGSGASCAPAETVPGCVDAGCCVPFCATDDVEADAACDAAVAGTACTAVFPPETTSVVGVCSAP